MEESDWAISFPCDRFLEQVDEVYYRGVEIQAAPAVVFRWLCQLRVAPYSYDWIDNFGRKSPEVWTPGLEHLEMGQVVMTMFELVAFEMNRHLTIRSRQDVAIGRWFGEIAGSYLIVPGKDDGCRLLVKLCVRYPEGFRGFLLRGLLPYGDWVMMRKQLFTLKCLAERKGVSFIA
jgi:hypothetical protein